MGNKRKECKRNKRNGKRKEEGNDMKQELRKSGNALGLEEKLNERK